VNYRVGQRRTRRERGMSLLEVMVAISVMLLLFAVLAPSLAGFLELDLSSSASKLVHTYGRLRDEAVMRNLTFRIVYYPNEGKYVVEPGEPGALISASPERREAWEEEVRRKLSGMSEEEKAEWYRSRKQPFESRKGAIGALEVELPAGVAIGGVYTPQYGDFVRPGDVIDGQDEDQPLQVFSYIMNSGFTEHTLVHLVRADDPRSGFTIEVEPMSGVVKLHDELLELRDINEDLPTEGPDLPL